MPSKEYTRRYRFDLRDIAPPGILSFEAEGKDVSDAMNKLAKKRGEDIADIDITLDAAYVWNPTKKEWVPHRPWWEEEKETYEWERAGENPLPVGEFPVYGRPSPTFEGLKKSGWFDIPEEILTGDIDPGIRDFIEKINELPYAATYGSCAGHTDEEWIAKGMYPPPPELNHAYLSVYISGDRRRDFFKWLKEHIDMNEVDIYMEPVGIDKTFDPFLGGSVFERWYPTMDMAYIKDKAFSVNIKSKKLHMPPLKARYGGFTTFNEMPKEKYYLTFNRDEIFKNLIASEGHFRNFINLKEDTAGYLNCIVKHLADAEGHCDEAISHALIAENEETSRSFLELRDEIRSFRKWIQSSPITRDEGIREIRKIRRRFESFNIDYDVSKCETCGDPAEIMEEVTKIIGKLKNNSHAVAAHESEAEGFLVLEREMAEKVIAILSEKYGVEPPKLIISDKCHEPMIGLYTANQIMVCKTGVNLHVLAHEFWHHVQSNKGMHLDEGDAEKFAVEFFKAPHQKGLYSIHEHSHSERKMVQSIKKVGTIYGLQQLGYAASYGLRYVDTLRPVGFLGQPLSFWGDLLGTVGGVVGALKLKAPYDLAAAMVGGYLSTNLWNHLARLVPMRVATTPLVYSPSPSAIVRPTPVVAPAPVIVSPPAVVTPSGRYQVTG